VSTEAIKQFIVGTIVPAVAGAAAAYLASKGVLNVFDISKATATTDIDELGVFVVVAGSGWLTSHHLLSGRYSPASKARGGSETRIVVNAGGGGGMHVGAAGETFTTTPFVPGVSLTGATKTSVVAKTSVAAATRAIHIVVRDLTSPGTLSTHAYDSALSAVTKQLLTHFNNSPWVEHGYVPPFGSFTVIAATAPIPTGCWVAEFIDEDPNAPGALGYHEDEIFDSSIEGKTAEAFAAQYGIPVTDIHSGRPRKASRHSMRGLAKHPETGELIPVLKILVKTTQADGASVSEVFSHEALEALVDPFVTSESAIRKYLDSSKERWVIGEIGDPVQGRGYTLAGAIVADFVYPGWFKQPQTRLPISCAEEHGTAARVEPFALAAGGYASVAPEKEAGNWSQIFGATV
jgi:hypothetical protein